MLKTMLGTTVSMFQALNPKTLNPKPYFLEPAREVGLKSKQPFDLVGFTG